jgi:hypothetical protein
LQNFKLKEKYFSTKEKWHSVNVNKILLTSIEELDDC